MSGNHFKNQSILNLHNLIFRIHDHYTSQVSRFAIILTNISTYLYLFSFSCIRYLISKFSDDLKNWSVLCVRSYELRCRKDENSWVVLGSFHHPLSRLYLAKGDDLSIFLCTHSCPLCLLLLSSLRQIFDQTSFNSNIADSQKLSMKQPSIDVLSNGSYPSYLNTFLLSHLKLYFYFILWVDVQELMSADGTAGDYTAELIANEEVQMVAVSGDPMLP